MATSIVDVMNRDTNILPIKERKPPTHSSNKPEACGYFATDDNKSSLPTDAAQEILDDASTVISNEAYTSCRSQRHVPNSQARTRPSTTYVEHGIEHQKYHLLVSQDMQSTAQMVDIWLDEDSRKAPFGQKAMRDHTKRATFGGDFLETWATGPNLAEIWNVGGEMYVQVHRIGSFGREARAEVSSREAC